MKSNFIFKGKLSGKFLIAIMPAFLLIFLLLSCKDELNTVQTTNKTNLISLEKAIEVAQAQSGSSKSVKGARESAEISSSLAVNPNGGDPTFYILNYKKGGFAIISADDRTVPVLAYSEKGSFPLNQKFYPLV